MSRKQPKLPSEAARLLPLKRATRPLPAMQASGESGERSRPRSSSRSRSDGTQQLALRSNRRSGSRSRPSSKQSRSKRSKSKSRSNSNSKRSDRVLAGGRLVDKGATACLFSPPLAFGDGTVGAEGAESAENTTSESTTSSDAVFLSTAYIGKVAQASQIAKTWRQSQRFARLDPEHRYGVYVVRAPEFIRLDRAVATAQGEDELKKCTRSFRALGPDMDTAIAIASATQSATQSASASSSGFASSIVNWTGIDDQVLPAAADAAAATRVARARTIVPSATQAGDAAKGASLGAGAEEVAGNGGSGGSGGSGGRERTR